ncbi:insulinase family protein [Clostridium sp. AWRP]|uniref:insulinase family protein n=1 Tax=Clostridium sp. AWRP TaxID=2212991 RepID=UPI000FDA38FB|nr:insulinase family protein [Clostridium sp. AWRP]AZV56556.1 hypothetical protein DMR38_08030 [Clostridium sp. AWRP]
MRLLKNKLIFLLTFVFIFQSVDLSSVFAAAENNNNNGFKLIKQTYISSLKTTVMQYVHVKSGAKLIYLKNDDPNKTFCINFRTPPSDNTGVNHIIEHCLLDGSKKYPVNNAGLTMNNQSLCKVENGHTGEESTQYYVTSSNDKDFMNFTGLLLDSVFYPNLLTNRNIFLQEGGHYEISADKSKAKYTGVVYSEQMSRENPSEMMNYKSPESVLPDTIYKWNSGGNLGDIPNVTYENVVKTYKKFYKPSNSYIYLYGNLNIDETLKYIDNNYLSKFDNEQVDSKISFQKPFVKGVDKTYYYNAKSNTDKNSTYFSENYVIDKITNTEAVNSFYVLYDILQSKLNKAASNNGLNEIDVMPCPFLQPVLTIECDNASEDQKAKFQKIIDDTLKDIVTNGIYKKDIKALISSYESQKNSESLNTAHGIHLNDEIMQSWLFDGDPTIYLDADKYVNILKKELNGRYFEDMIQKYLINNTHKSIVTLKAQKAAVQDKENIDTKSLSKSQIDKIIQDTEELKEWQSEVNSKDALSKLPLLSNSDLKLDKPEVNTSTSKDGTKMLFTPVNTSNGSYYNLYFDTSMIPQNKIPYINLLCYILTNGSSDKYNQFNSTNGTDAPTYGNIEFSSDAYGRFDSSTVYSPKIKAYAAVPNGNIDSSLKLLKEIINNTNFNNKDKIKDFINQAKISSKGEVYKNRFLGYLSEKGKYNDNLKGFPYYDFLCGLQDNYDLKWNEIQANLTDVYNIVFNKSNLIVGFVGTDDSYASFQKSFSDFLKNIKYTDSKPVNYKFNDASKNEAIPTLSPNINGVYKGCNINKLGYKYNGSMKVLGAVINDYLINQVRTSGGYGADSTINEDGNIYFSTARMPDINKSMEIFNTLPSYLKNFKADNDEMMRYKIGAFKKLTNSGSQVYSAISSQEDTIKGKTQSDYEMELSEILNTTPEDINNMSNMIQDVVKQNVFFVLGNKDKINAQKDMFSRIIHLTK